MLRTIARQTSWVESNPPNAKCRTSSIQSGRLIPENTIVSDTAMQPRIAIPAHCARRDGDPTSTVVAAFMMDACATRSSAKPLPVPECNNRTPNPRTRNQVKINTPCCVAKAVHYARSHPSARRTPGPIAPRGARAQDAFSDDPKDHSPCAPAQSGAGSAVSPLHLCYPRSGTRPLVIGPRHRGRIIAIQLRRSSGSGARGHRRNSDPELRRSKSGTLAAV